MNGTFTKLTLNGVVVEVELVARDSERGVVIRDRPTPDDLLDGSIKVHGQRWQELTLQMAVDDALTLYDQMRDMLFEKKVEDVRPVLENPNEEFDDSLTLEGWRM